MTEETNQKIRRIIYAVSRLGWVRKDPSKGSEDLYMHLADVEKTITAVLEGTYEYRLAQWLEAAKMNGTVCDRPPELQIRELTELRKAVAIQRDIIAPLMQGKRCVYKWCPFFKQDVPEV